MWWIFIYRLSTNYDGNRCWSQVPPSYTEQSCQLQWREGDREDTWEVSDCQGKVHKKHGNEILYFAILFFSTFGLNCLLWTLTQYGSHQMTLIRKRLKVEMWMYDRLQEIQVSWHNPLWKIDKQNISYIIEDWRRRGNRSRRGSRHRRWSWEKRLRQGNSHSSKCPVDNKILAILFSENSHRFKFFTRNHQRKI